MAPSVASITLASYTEAGGLAKQLRYSCGESYDISEPEPKDGQWVIRITLR